MRKVFLTLVACGLMSSLLAPQANSADGAKAKTPVASGVMQQGKAAFAQWCAGCHSPLTGMPGYPPAGTYILEQRYKGAMPAALEERTDLTPDMIKTAVRYGLPIMPPFRKTELTDAELDTVVAYLTKKK